MRKLLILLSLLILLLASSAYADSARVVTPGGKLNMRKAPKDKAKLAAYVPNNSLVEVEEVGEEWTKIVYKNKTGYVKNEYLRIASSLPGMTVYGDEGALILLYEEADSQSQVMRPVSAVEAIEITDLDGDFALADVGGDTGYVKVAYLSYQNQEPAATLSWISQPGRAEEACSLFAAADKKSDILGELSMGDEVTVSLVEKDLCLVATEFGCGYAPLSAISLKGPEDSDESAGSVDPMDAVESAKAYLSKSYKTFDDEPLYYQIAPVYDQDGLEGPLYACGFFNDHDQYVFGALVDADTGETVFAASYAGFAQPSDNVHLLPQGEMTLSLSADSLTVGEILDVTVTAWTNHQCQYTLVMDGKTIFKGEETDHFEASYRPREAGDYLLTVTVTDKEGFRVSLAEAFTVSAGTDASLYEVYSQKDGWWQDKVYRKSDLDQSGCAIFALAHALNRMDITGEDTHPVKLAKEFSLCLTADGTNNERLLREASEVYGFGTARDLIENKKKIVSLLKEGCMFSFSVCRGHIAMISGLSEDGSMVRVVDSAPSATIERLVNASIYYQTRSGSWRIASSLSDIEGARWYFETNNYGGLEYWMTVDYAARRGVRLIDP